MLSIMNRGKRFLKVQEDEDILKFNDVRIGSDGLIDPFLDFEDSSQIFGDLKIEDQLLKLESSELWRLPHQLGQL